MTTIPGLRKILYVEDEPDIQEITRLALELAGGFEVEVCGSGEEALRVAPVFEPDLVLLDVMMPHMDGPTTFQALRKDPRLARTPIIFMTAKVQAHEIAQYLELGALDVISKPIDPMALPDTVRSIWSRNMNARREIELHDELEALRTKFAEGLPERLKSIEQAWATVEAADWSGDALMPLFRAAHSLAGAGATFGFPEIGADARRLADEVLIYLKGRRPKSPDSPARFAPLIAAVGKSLPLALPPANRPRPRG